MDPEAGEGSEGSSDGSGSTTTIIFKLIRLLRVVRAFRLGRRFQAVIIIARSMRRSVRAIWVLILNIILNMIICGAVIFFVEQGTYRPETREYWRFSSYWALGSDGTFE